MVKHITRALTLTAAASLAMTACSDKEYSINLPENQLVTGIFLDVNPELPLAVGTDSAIAHYITPEMPTNAALAWKSSNELVATVSPDGVISALSTGRAVITVTPAIGFGYNDCIKSIAVEVIPEVIKVTALEFLTQETALYAGDQLQLEVKLYPVNHTYSHLYWTSSDPSVATVEGQGLVSGVTPGEVDITARTHDGGNILATKHLTILKSEPALDVTVLPYGDVLYFKQPLQLDIVTTPADATRATVQWSSSDENILTVDANGLVLAKNFGTASITATCTETGKSSSVELIVAAGFYLWSNVNNFEEWTINNNLGKFTIEGGKMHCTVTDDANKRIYLQRCYSQNKDIMDMDFVNYPIMAFKAEGAVKGIQAQCNFANMAKTLSVSPAMKALDTTDGNVIYYYDFSDYASLSNDQGLVPIRAFIFKLLKSPVATFDIEWIRTFKTMDEVNAAAAAQ